MKMGMLFRFSLYGFLKEQLYFEPFFMLFLLSLSLNYTQIGVLIGFREILKNLLEIPSGSFADLYGRRISLIISLLSYIASFLLFGMVHHFLWLFIPMFFFAIGEAFRTGTHKAMIFHWLRINHRLAEKTQVYGYTRSWSKIGSAVSIIVAMCFVLWQGDYRLLFFYSMIPYGIGVLNIASYPKELEARKSSRINLLEMTSHFFAAIKKTVYHPPLRKLVVETMAFEGTFETVKDYIQPLLKNLALLLPWFIGADDVKRSALMVGSVYFILYIISAYASRKSHRLVRFTQSEEKSIHWIWMITTITYLIMLIMLLMNIISIAIILFILLYLLQNIWRPIQISRFDHYADESEGATILSIESQSKAMATMIMAPLIGAAVDGVATLSLGNGFWPVAALGLMVSAYFGLTS